MAFTPQRTLFGFLVMVYDRVGDGDKFLNEHVALERPLFHATSELKIKARGIFLVSVNATS